MQQATIPKETRKIVQVGGRKLEASSLKSDEFSHPMLIEGKKFYLRRSDLLDPKIDFEKKGPSEKKSLSEDKTTAARYQGGSC